MNPPTADRRALVPSRTRTVRRRGRHPRTPGFLLVEPTARREGRPYPGSQKGVVLWLMRILVTVVEVPI
jgi:hypothetical protein